MADEGDTPMRTEDDSSGSESGTESEEVEWLATAREKRSTAGNRLTSLLQQEEQDDDLELLFAEDDDDAGFEDAEADQSDVQMDSSDDDEDQGPAAGADDLDGENEIRRQEKAERAKKRKVNDGIPKIFKTKVKIDPTISQAPPARPKKKSERASWIPTAEDLPKRASERGTTKQRKQELHAQMVNRELKRLRQLANMEKAAKKKEAAKKPAMTQADRLREAARVEKQNFKSLSRWEEAEQQREEEQRAKLAALHNRHLEGPVISWRSEKGEWVDGDLKKVGKREVHREKKMSKKRKAEEMEADSAPGPSTAQAPTVSSSQPGQPNPDAPTASTAPASASSPPTNASIPTKNASPATETAQQSPPPTSIPASTSLPPQTSMPTPPSNPPYPQFILAPPGPPPSLDGSSPLPGFYQPPPNQPFMPPQVSPFTYAPSQPPPPPVPRPPLVEHATHNYLVLANFDEAAIKTKEVQAQVLFKKKFTKPHKPPKEDKCAITMYPARFRDPSTGLLYCSTYAYREIQKLKRGEYRWSKLVGAYVGLGTYAARGVPDRFKEALVPKVQSVK